MSKRKPILLALTGILLLFATITMINALVLDSKQPTPQSTEIVFDEKAAIDHFSKAITFKTISYEDRSKFDFNEFDKFIDYLKETYPAVHTQLELEKVNNYALLYKWSGTDSSKNPIGLTSHYDVVERMSMSASKTTLTPLSSMWK